MAEKKVFAQIDVLGSNQTPMDAFIYMEDQGGGGGDEKVLTFDTATFVQAEPEQTSFPGATSVYRLELTNEQYDQIINQRYSVHLKGVSPFNNGGMVVESSVVDMVFENQYLDVDIETDRFDIKTYKQTGTENILSAACNIELHLNVNHQYLEFAQYIKLTEPKIILQPEQIRGMSSDMSTIQIQLDAIQIEVIKNNTAIIVDGTEIGFKEATLYKDMFGDLIAFETGINHDEQETLDSYEVTNMWTMTVKVDYETGMAIMMTKQFQIGGGGTGSTEINIDNQFTPLDETLTKFRLSNEIAAKIYSTIADGVLPVISMTYPIDESNISILRISVESASFATTRSAEPTPGFIGMPFFNLVGNIAGNKMNARIYFGYDQEGGTDFPELDILPEEGRKTLYCHRVAYLDGAVNSRKFIRADIITDFPDIFTPTTLAAFVHESSQGVGGVSSGVAANGMFVDANKTYVETVVSFCSTNGSILQAYTARVKLDGSSYDYNSINLTTNPSTFRDSVYEIDSTNL